MKEGTHFSTPSLALVISWFVDYGHSDWCEVVPHCSFDLHFSNNQWCSASFHIFWEVFCLLWWNVYLGLLPIFQLGCISCLYILEIKPLSVASFETIFSHSVSCLFFVVFVLFCFCFCGFLWIYGSLGLLDHMVVPFFIFKGTSILFSTVIVPIYIPTNSEGGFPFLYCL